jgi:hypothetical protein
VYALARVAARDRAGGSVGLALRVTAAMPWRSASWSSSEAHSGDGKIDPSRLVLSRAPGTARRCSLAEIDPMLAASQVSSSLGRLAAVAVVLAGCASGARLRDDAADTTGDGSVELPDGADGGVMRQDSGGTCTDVCPLGASRCSGTEVQHCVIDAATPCTIWAEPEACSGALFCSGDACTDTCVDACTAGARRCGSDAGYQLCELQPTGCHDWSAEVVCEGEQSCVGEGTCMPCTDGAERCSSAGHVQACTDGSWETTEGCGFGCDASGATATCRTSVTCTAGAYRCSGPSVETCSATGTAWLHVATCAVGCAAGLCTGACEPGATRCNAGGVETCNEEGTAWAEPTACATFCDAGVCALDGLEIAADRTMEGLVLVEGAVIVRSGATLTSSTGDLTIRATSITVENGASISVAATGMSPEGAGSAGYYSSGYYYGGRGGGYGDGRTWGSPVDSDVRPGSPGGAAYGDTPLGGPGGGVMRLFADSITIAGQVTANGAPGGTSGSRSSGGGSGGGILIAADQLRISGALSAIGGAGGGTGSSGAGGSGGQGRVKILHGAELDTTGAVITGVRTEGLMPPMVLSSSTHPDPERVYNDGFDVVAMNWARPFAPINGYYWSVDTAIAVPTPAIGRFAASEVVAFDHSMLSAGDNLFQVVSVDPMITIGTVESSFRIRMNSTPPALTSSSHASSTTWSENRDVFLRWTLPHPDENYRGIYYVFDHFGDTVPDTGANFVPIEQKQTLLSGTADGVWAFHIVSLDTQGYLTRAASHYRVQIGEDPGSGTVFGQIVDAATSMPISGVRVTINRDLFPPQTTNGTGNFNFMSIPAGTYEVTITHEGHRTERRMVTVTADAMTAVNASLTEE